MSNLILWPLIIVVAVCAWLIFGGLRNHDKPDIVQRIKKALTRRHGGSGDDGGG